MTIMQLREKLDILLDGQCGYLLNPSNGNGWSAQVMYNDKYVVVERTIENGYILYFEGQKCCITDESVIANKVVEMLTNYGTSRYLD